MKLKQLAIDKINRLIENQLEHVQMAAQRVVHFGNKIIYFTNEFSKHEIIGSFAGKKVTKLQLPYSSYIDRINKYSLYVATDKKFYEMYLPSEFGELILSDLQEFEKSDRKRLEYIAIHQQLLNTRKTIQEHFEDEDE